MLVNPEEPARQVRVEWNSPQTNELRSHVMTEAEAEKWWEMASHPVRETARFTPS